MHSGETVALYGRVSLFALPNATELSKPPSSPILAGWIAKRELKRGEDWEALTLIETIKGAKKSV